MLFTDTLGYAAGLLLVISLLPQIHQSWTTKSTRDLSLSRYIIYTFAVALWLFYGIIKQDGPIITLNSVALLLAASILYLKIKHG